MNFLATLHTSDKTLFYVTIQAAGESVALDKLIHHLSTYPFIVCDDKIAVRCTDVLRCMVELLTEEEK